MVKKKATVEVENEFISCTPKSLPGDLLVDAGNTAVRENPCNDVSKSGLLQFLIALAIEPEEMPPEHIALMRSRYWGASPRVLSVSFMDSPPADLRARLLTHFNAWGKTCCITFKETSGTGQVRVARTPDQGYWSYLGTDVLHIPVNQQTMNLDSFTMKTPESEFHRVVRHEVGHTLGFPHEHMRKELIARLVPEKVIAYFMATQGWSRQEVIAQVLTPLDDATLFETPPDQTSIMCYQIDASLTTDGKPVIGGEDINDTDYTFAGRMYPLATVPPPVPLPSPPPVTPPVTGRPVNVGLYDAGGKLVYKGPLIPV